MGPRNYPCPANNSCPYLLNFCVVPSTELCAVCQNDLAQCWDSELRIQGHIITCSDLGSGSYSSGCPWMTPLSSPCLSNLIWKMGMLKKYWDQVKIKHVKCL